MTDFRTRNRFRILFAAARMRHQVAASPDSIRARTVRALTRLDSLAARH